MSGPETGWTVTVESGSAGGLERMANVLLRVQGPADTVEEVRALVMALLWDSRWEDFEEWCEDEANSGSYLRGAYGDTGTGHSPEDWVADLVKAAKLAQKALEMRRRWEVGPSHRVRRWREAGLPVSLSETDTVNAELAALEALRGLVQ